MVVCYGTLWVMGIDDVKTHSPYLMLEYQPTYLNSSVFLNLKLSFGLILSYTFYLLPAKKYVTRYSQL